MSAADKKSELMVSLRSLTVEELDTKIKDTREDLFWLRFKNRSGQSVTASDIQKKKVTLARMNTVVSEKQKATPEISNNG